ncbi:MAG: DNA-directed RNA polymerase subunit delta [Mycoplasma sp.]
MNLELETAREIILKTKNASNSIKFDKLWKGVCAKCKNLSELNEEQSSDFYISLLESPNFIKLNSNEWTLKELFALDEVKKISSPVYTTEEFEINEDDYANYLSDIELKEMKEEKEEKISTPVIDLDDESTEYGQSDILQKVKDSESIIELEGEEYEE